MVKIELNATLTRLVEMTKGKGVVVKMVFSQIFLDGFGKTIGQIYIGNAKQGLGATYVGLSLQHKD